MPAYLTEEQIKYKLSVERKALRHERLREVRAAERIQAAATRERFKRGFEERKELAYSAAAAEWGQRREERREAVGATLQFLADSVGGAHSAARSTREMQRQEAEAGVAVWAAGRTNEVSREGTALDEVYDGLEAKRQAIAAKLEFRNQVATVEAERAAVAAAARSALSLIHI